MHILHVFTNSLGLNALLIKAHLYESTDIINTSSLSYLQTQSKDLEYVLWNKSIYFEREKCILWSKQVKNNEDVRL